MNKKLVLILGLVFALVLIGAGVLYNSLAGSVQMGGLATTPQETQAPAESQAPAETEGENPGQTTETQPTEPAANMAPDFTMLDMEGGEVNLASFFGKPIILNFWASWCGPCKSEMPEIQKFYEEYGEEIHFLLVSVDESLDTAKAFIAENGYTFPVYFDASSLGAYTYGASSIPLTFFIDAEGNLTAYYMGAMTESILQQGVDMIRPAAAE
jgi:thiol-disulfide isomerase/thioredoxin